MEWSKFQISKKYNESGIEISLIEELTIPALKRSKEKICYGVLFRAKISLMEKTFQIRKVLARGRYISNLRP